MNDKLFKDLGKEASKAFLDNLTPMNETITKMAQERGLNQEQIARVCENANLSTYSTKMAGATDRKFEFELADKAKIFKNLAMQEPVKPVKTAHSKDADYFVKTATISNDSTVFAPEYDTDGRFLASLSDESSEDIVIKVADATPALDKEGHKKRFATQKDFVLRNKIAAAKESLEAELMLTYVKLSSAIDKAVELIKQAALNENPFLIWREYDNSDKSEIADKIFVKAAKDISAFSNKRATELLLEAKNSVIPQHDDYILERKVKIVGRDPIIKQIDAISNFKKIIDKIEDFKSNGGVYERSSTPDPGVAHTSDEGVPALDYYKKLIAGE